MNIGKVFILCLPVCLTTLALSGCSEMNTSATKPAAAAPVASEPVESTESSKATSAPVPQAQAPVAETQVVVPEMSLKEAQAKLNELGFSVGRVDGLMGPRTRAGLKRFQQDRNLPVTGELDDATIVELSH